MNFDGKINCLSQFILLNPSLVLRDVEDWDTPLQDHWR